jgi:WXXGXW repeat (2 copies)
MKLNGKMMMAVVMMVGSLAATGCSTASAADTGAVAPEETAATAPVDDSTASTSATPGVEQDARSFHYFAPHAPPAARVEFRGVAPSARHFWAPGYYRYNGREHVWVGGRWDLRRDGFDFRAPHWVNRAGRFEYLPGRWVRR